MKSFIVALETGLKMPGRVNTRIPDAQGLACKGRHRLYMSKFDSIRFLTSEGRGGKGAKRVL